MRTRLVVCGLLTGLVMFLAASFVVAQDSLGDFARKERERRAKQAKTAAKVYTNENIPAATINVVGPQAGENASTNAAPAAGGKGAAKTAPGAEASSDDKKHTKEYWADKFKAARDALAHAEEEQRVAEDDLDLAMKRQASQVSAQNDPLVAADVAAKRAAVDPKRAAVDKAKKDLEALESDFSSSGAPADWAPPK